MRRTVARNRRPTAMAFGWNDRRPAPDVHTGPAGHDADPRFFGARRISTVVMSETDGRCFGSRRVVSQQAVKPDYGIDAPGVVRNLFVVLVLGAATFVSARVGLWSGVLAHINVAQAGLGAGLGCGLMACWMLYDSKIGKLKERETLLDRIDWRGDEAVLDVGCGRGLLLVAAARRLKAGIATGLDLWQAEDLTGNTPQATIENARIEGVADRVVVKTGDMRAMPFPDGSFDIVVSNVAIHNVYEREGREKTMREIARVLKPGGRVVIADIRYVNQYAEELSRSGLAPVDRVGSKLAMLFLVVTTMGSLRPDILVGSKPARAVAAGKP